ncbi:MAG: hypothetical protein ACYSSP_05930 [Planctomycetota bacterium]|jgi:hypothetical protein
MPVGKRQPANTLMYAVIFFVVLSLIAIVSAVLFYLRAENLNQEFSSIRDQNQELITQNEYLNISNTIGTKQSGETYLGNMVRYLDDMVYLILGGTPEQRSAEAKVSDVTSKYQTSLSELTSQNYVQVTDPNITGLIWVIEQLKNNLANTIQSENELKNSLSELQNLFDDANSANFRKHQILLAEKEQYRQQVEDVRKGYEELQALMEQSTEEQVQTLMTSKGKLEAQNKDLEQRLMKTDAEFQLIQERMSLAQEQLDAIAPPPDSSAAAYKPDGEILLIDDQSKIVHINIGSKDRVYQGLTFSVYDKHAPIPKDGKGKAQIEVYSVGDTISAARIIQDDIKNPIILNDIVINLIWDKDRSNVFAVAGDFDVDGDTVVDVDGPEKIKALINKWGGVVIDTVTIDTDYVLLGQEPFVPRRPTFEEIGIDPLAEDRYNAAIQRRERYLKVQEQAQGYSIPVFNTERFLYFIGYKTLADRPGAF